MGLHGYLKYCIMGYTLVFQQFAMENGHSVRRCSLAIKDYSYLKLPQGNSENEGGWAYFLARTCGLLLWRLKRVPMLGIIVAMVIPVYSMDLSWTDKSKPANLIRGPTVTKLSKRFQEVRRLSLPPCFQDQNRNLVGWWCLHRNFERHPVVENIHSQICKATDRMSVQNI